MARKSTIAHAQKVLTDAEFRAYMQMPAKLSKAQLEAGMKPDLSILAAPADAPEAKPAGKSKSKAKAAAKPKVEREAKPPQAADKREKIFGSLEEGFALYATVGDKVLAFEVTKVTKKTRSLKGAKGESAKLTLKGGDTVLKVNGEAVAVEKLRYKRPAGEQAVQVTHTEPEAPVVVTTAKPKSKGKRKPKAASAKAPKGPQAEAVEAPTMTAAELLASLDAVLGQLA
jgi:hypothetical protein